MKSWSLILSALVLSLGLTARAQDSGMDELDPFDPNIEQQLQEMDQDYQEQTGETPRLMPEIMPLFGAASCYRQNCDVYALVVKSEQRLYLYLNGRLRVVWPVSTGVAGHRTPDFDTHPDGRIYDRYTSKKYPGGDYNGLGNMPYAVFISGGFAIHGTGQGNWQYLGQPASHGCVRVHPDNAFTFNRLVRQYGISRTWITVQ